MKSTLTLLIAAVFAQEQQAVTENKAEAADTTEFISGDEGNEEIPEQMVARIEHLKRTGQPIQLFPTVEELLKMRNL